MPKLAPTCLNFLVQPVLPVLPVLRVLSWLRNTHPPVQGAGCRLGAGRVHAGCRGVSVSSANRRSYRLGIHRNPPSRSTSALAQPYLVESKPPILVRLTKLVICFARRHVYASYARMLACPYARMAQTKRATCSVGAGRRRMKRNTARPAAVLAILISRIPSSPEADRRPQTAYLAPRASSWDPSKNCPANQDTEDAAWPHTHSREGSTTYRAWVVHLLFYLAHLEEVRSTPWPSRIAGLNVLKMA